VPEEPHKLPDFVSWPSFPFEGDLRVKALEPVADTEPPRLGEEASDCPSCAAPDDAYIWVSDRWRVRATEKPSGLPMVLILESRSHLDLGDLSNLLAAELGVMTVRLERAIRSLDGVARVHVNRWSDGAAHLHLWFLGRPTGRLQLRGSFLSLWEDILPPVDESRWREDLALVAAWLGEFGGRALAEPPRIEWQAPSTLSRVPPLDFAEESEGGGHGSTGRANPADSHTGERKTITTIEERPAVGAPVVEPWAARATEPGVRSDGGNGRGNARRGKEGGKDPDDIGEPGVVVPQQAQPSKEMDEITSTA
jgi:diadenosine tetraphosphate (Ap4A) HIT family hydrolase